MARSHTTLLAAAGLAVVAIGMCVGQPAAHEVPKRASAAHSSRDVRHTPSPGAASTPADPVEPQEIQDDPGEDAPDEVDAEPAPAAATGPHDGSEIARKFECIAYMRRIAFLGELLGKLSESLEPEPEASVREHIAESAENVEMPNEECAGEAVDQLQDLCLRRAALAVPVPELAALCD